MSFNIQFLAQNLFLSKHSLNQTEYQAEQVALCQASNLRWESVGGLMRPDTFMKLNHLS